MDLNLRDIKKSYGEGDSRHEVILVGRSLSLSPLQFLRRHQEILW